MPMPVEVFSPQNEKAVCADSAASQRLSDCWLAALGTRPTHDEDTLGAHGVGRKYLIRLASRVRGAFGCDLTARCFHLDIPFRSTAALLQPLLLSGSASSPEVYLAPGQVGTYTGELLLLKDYPCPEQIRLIRYPSLARMLRSRQIFEDIVQATLDQLPSPKDRCSNLVLAGYSFGAHVMHEVACRLARIGREPSRLILMNSVAFPQREHLSGADLRFSECCSLRDLACAFVWKLSGSNHSGLRRLSSLLGLLQKGGLIESLEEFEFPLSRRVRLRSSQEFHPSRFPGDIYLLRPSEGVPTSDDGWSALCDRVHCISFPVPRPDFLNASHRRLIAQEFGRLVAQPPDRSRYPVLPSHNRSGAVMSRCP